MSLSLDKDGIPRNLATRKFFSYYLYTLITVFFIPRKLAQRGKADVGENSETVLIIRLVSEDGECRAKASLDDI